ncbi:MAG: prepilin-type N-terminal cleavage/methylation domain-containing protein [Kiritimatiellae bacterium]|nr:prepilin-type N-terminal cleavage/methylation domain-containing protein [Kiritimatiellia bacterium]
MPRLIPTCRQSDRLAGFTLIEVLVAIVILSVCVVGILHAFDSSLSALGVSRNCLWSGMLINEKISEFEGYAREHDEAGMVSGRGAFTGSYSDFRWKSDVSDVSVETDIDNPPYDLKMLTVTVWRDGTKDEYSAVTYLRLFNSTGEE